MIRLSEIRSSDLNSIFIVKPIFELILVSNIKVLSYEKSWV